MATTKVAVSLDSKLLQQLDRLVAERIFPNRSQAVQDAVRDKLDRLARSRLARECAKLDIAAELELKSGTLPKRSWVKISQVRTLSTQRLGICMSRVSPEELE
jgi:Arc/MetJ-type ribon-helix-helix transcriptional regulator